ncbi:MAG: DUF4333 domain-containing protein [Actinophytocola sp.]|uniref:DUF4333 domain-containing protein n=1 Tax=Actinophytocola sp. TaxID=1872138 RepID=UPI0013222A23|nr:DUF4333 domain-containing protein [Actinophytocola sp.]MPZ79373.1 DUF4333 domain-containing protein [Actinophytocola sp.]
MHCTRTGCGEGETSEPPEINPPGVNVPDMPSLDVLDEELLEGADGVRQYLAEQYQHTDVGSVDCPGRLALEFDCAVSVAGQEKTVTVTVLDENGEFEVSEPW